MSARRGRWIGDPAVCAVQVDVWRQCAEDNVADPAALRARCDPLAENFEKCIVEWRTADNGRNATTQLRGEGPGEPPIQCAPLSCMIASCLHQNKFEFSKCQIPSEYFKRCVKGLYGSEYITD